MEPPRSRRRPRAPHARPSGRPPEADGARVGERAGAGRAAERAVAESVPPHPTPAPWLRGTGSPSIRAAAWGEWVFFGGPPTRTHPPISIRATPKPRGEI